MKTSAALPLLLLFVVSCSDTPSAPSGLASPTSVTGVIAGNPPPPPADVSVLLCSPAGCSVFDGTYFSNGADATVAASITQQLDGACAFPEATSWLKFGNHQTGDPLATEGTVSSNAQIRCHNGTAAGTGSVSYEVGGVQVVIQFRDVLTFLNSPECSLELPFCAEFTATVTENGVPIGTAHGEAFNREFFEQFCSVDDGEIFCPRGEGVD